LALCAIEPAEHDRQRARYPCAPGRSHRIVRWEAGSVPRGFTKHTITAA
jgi:hypothetical protein